MLGLVYKLNGILKGCIVNNKKIFIAGHNGMVGSAILRNLKAKGYSNFITASRQELDLCIQADVYQFLKKHQPEYIFIAAAKVGGIHANNVYRAEFIYQNLMVQNNIIHAAWQLGIEKLLFLGSSCIYPRECPQPIHEDYLLTGPLEPTNEPYAIAKIAGVKMCESYNRQYGMQYISVMPTNLYGPNDNYNLNTSHVVPALIRKCHEAKLNKSPEVMIWGSGQPRREFLYVDDMADACVRLMEGNPEHALYNIGMGEDLTIRELAQTIAKVVAYEGQLKFDTSKPDGTPQKLLNIDRIKEFGWHPTTTLEQGLEKAYADFLTKGILISENAI
jgi:GDP-L-fucose synthase